MSAKMTHKQRAALAHLVLAHGYDNLREFWGEINGTQNLPPLEVCEDILHGWHKRMIDLGDKHLADRRGAGVTA